MFKNFFFMQYPLYFPEDGVGGIADLPVDDKVDEDNVDDKDDKVDDEDDDEDKEDKDDIDDKEDKDDDLALARVDYKQVKEKFPSLFKDFPELKHAFFREQQFSELFPTVEEAQRALDAQTAYEEITASVLGGDATKFITELKAEDEKGFNKFARAFIPALKEQNKDLYFDIVAPTVQTFVKNVYAHARTIDNEEERNNVKSAAKIVHKILFGGEYNDIEKEESGLFTRGNEPDNKKDDDDRNKLLQSKYTGLYKDVTQTCYSKLDEEIAKGLDDLKARPGLKNLVAKAVRDKVLEELEKDQAYMGRMQGLWKREQRNGFSGTLKNSLITTFLAKSKAIVPKIRTDMRKEVIGKEQGNNGTGKTDSTRVTGGRESRGSKKPMSVARMKEEKITTTKGIFDAD